MQAALDAGPLIHLAEVGALTLLQLYSTIPSQPRITIPTIPSVRSATWRLATRIVVDC
jgi:hypothetical protein